MHGAARDNQMAREPKKERERALRESWESFLPRIPGAAAAAAALLNKDMGWSYGGTSVPGVSERVDVCGRCLESLEKAG